MATDAASNVLLWIELALYALLVYPICIYGCYVLRQDWNKWCIVKRRRNLILLMLIICCIALLFSGPMLIILNITYDKVVEIAPYYYWIALTPMKFALMGCTSLFIARIWLYYFDINYSKEISNKEWKILLNDHLNVPNWYVAHKYTYGSEKWWIIRIMVATTLFVIVYCTLYQFLGVITDFIAIALYMVLFSLMAVMWYKYPRFNDVLGIRNELKKIAIPWCIGLLIGEVNVAVSIIVNGSDFYIFLTIFVLSVDITAIVYLSTIDVHIFTKKNEKTDNDYIAYHSAMNSNSTSNHSNVIIQSWRPFVGIMEGYELFMEHVHKEFSTENLLFLTEYAQFKELLIKKYENEMKELKTVKGLEWKLILPSDGKLPISLINDEFKKNDKDYVFDYIPFLNATLKLYNKYIKANHAPYEINISSSNRYALQRIFNEYSDDKNDKQMLSNEILSKILIPMERAVNEIESLMTDSFSRFRNTTIAKEFWMEYLNDEK